MNFTTHALRLSVLGLGLGWERTVAGASHVSLTDATATNADIHKDVNRKTNAHLRIIGGSDTEGVVEHMVGLGRSDSTSNSPFCGGSLISPRIVLTSASCVRPTSGSNPPSLRYPTKVLVNMYNTSDSTGVESIDLTGIHGQDVFIHPDYDKTYLNNDIALIILPSNVNTGITRYATVNDDANVPAAAGGEILHVMGWGYTSRSLSGRNSEILLDSEVVHVTNEQCEEDQGWLSTITDGMVCAGGNGNDFCYSDTGGPLTLIAGGADPIQIGIASWGGCIQQTSPGVYTRVSYYADWMKEMACVLTGDFCPSCPPTQTLLKVLIIKYNARAIVTCLPDEPYVFTIEDDGNDGICCSAGDGFYVFSHGDEEAIGGDFGTSESISFGTSCLPSNSPSLSFQPSFLPSESPSETLHPSTIPSESPSKSLQPSSIQLALLFF